MPSAQDIRRRIKTVKNIEQITKAMKMVAAARLRRAQERANSGRPYTEKIRELLTSVACNTRETIHPLLEVREVKRTGYLILSSDKGLAGAYATNIIKEVMPRLAGGNEYGLIVVGRKARDYFRRRAFKIDQEYTGFSEKPAFANAVAIAAHTAEKFIDGTYDEIYLTYTQFVSPITQKPVTIRLLPVAEPCNIGNGKHEYIYDPTPVDVLAQLLPKYLETVIYGALMQAAASELGARMTAMGAATDNAEELIAKLVLNYNKVRQATITREITEIVGGAEALK